MTDQAVPLEFPPPDDEPPISTFMEKVLAATIRGVVGFFRQSSDGQRKRHKGSQRAQEEHLEQLHPFGVTREQVHVILAYGESGNAGTVRKRFGELKEAVRARKVGLILLARHDRLGRNTPDAFELFQLLVEHGVLLMVDGRVYDPSNEGDALILGLYAQFAEYENRVRSRWMGVTRLAKARAYELRIRLPTGLVWADPFDPDYRSKAEDAGLLDWLEEPLGRPCSEFEERKYYILPYPDRDVATALRLFREWLLETRSVAEVEKRIREGSNGWPHPGLLPASRTSKPYPKVRIGWEPVNATMIRDHLNSPALFGCYRYNASALRKKKPGGVTAPVEDKPKLQRKRADVELPGAFRSWFAPEEERVIRRILAGNGRKPFAKNPERTASVLHAVGTLRCAMELAPGTLCGRRINAYYPFEGSDRPYYHTGGCRQTRKPHFYEVSGELDEHVLEILLEVFRPDALREVATQLRVQRSSSQGEVRSLWAEIRRAEQLRESAEKLALDAKGKQTAAEHAHEEAAKEDKEELAKTISDQKEQVERWQARAADASRRIRELKARIAEQERRLRDYDAIADEELQKCVAVATDLPGLIDRARTIPGALQRIVECLTSEVWVRKLATGIFELRVEFASGESVVRVFRDSPPPSTQPLRLLAFNQLEAGADPVAVATEVARYPNPDGRKALPLDADDIRAVAMLHRHFESDLQREGEHWSVEEIASRVGSSREKVLSFALAGSLGPARWGTGGLLLRPSDKELHRSFREFAKREVARLHGVEPEALITGSEVYRANRWVGNGSVSSRLRKYVQYKDATGWVYFRRRDVEGAGLSMAVNEQEVEECRQALLDAVASLGRPELRAEDFHPSVNVVRSLGERFHRVTCGKVRKVAAAGHIPSVRCRGLIDRGRVLPNLLFVHVPPHVLQAGSESVVLEWLGAGRRIRRTRHESVSGDSIPPDSDAPDGAA